MRRHPSSIDDLHICAVAEFDGDGPAVELLNEMYVSIRADYIAVFEALRALREYAS
jgi:hypothetical protein